MKTPWSLRETRRLFLSGGVFAYPTEAVYGLGCNPLDPYAVHRILAIKQRPANKGLILIAADLDQLLPFIRPLPDPVMAPILASWPGPHTWLLPAATDVPHWIKGEHDTVAVRVTSHPIAAALCRACQSPLISTSANTAGKKPITTSLGVRKQLPYGIDHIVAGSLGVSKKPTTIRDGRSGDLLRG